MKTNLLLQVFIELLGGVVDVLYQNSIQENLSPVFNGMNLVSVITIIRCFDEIIPKLDNIPLNTVIQLVYMLRLVPEVQNKKCYDWAYLELYIEDSCRKVTSEAVLRFVLQLSHKKHLSQNEWLFAVPLVHFLYKISLPFEERELDPCKLRWKDEDRNIIGWSGIRSDTYDSEFG